eukprot:CAMPEP_0180178946 /NCGR_PEP_ID=MMETSP0986-20121125/38741_1 /TAXON_ID=697907 /ORGANISM="non described non described, Strain CCMP2293" /LENGTH=128 /DNA_ID=CAMNT_0022131957 /DNA_START=92 /DNA_END=478 /DNA_ORIENTATION=-
MALQAQWNACVDFTKAPGVDSALEIILRPLRHTTHIERADLPASFVSTNVERRWLPQSLLPIDAPVKIVKGKNPYDRTERTERGDVAIVGQCFVDTAVYSIPGMVGGIAVFDRLVADQSSSSDDLNYV